MTFTQTTVFSIVFLFVTSALGAAFVYCFSARISQKFHALFFGFTAGVMIAASVWSLLLPALEQAQNGWGRYAFIPVSLGILLGAAFLFLLDKFFPQRTDGAENTAQISPSARRLFLAVTLHNIPEGLAVGFALGAAYSLGEGAAYAAALGLALGIGIQNIPEGAALSLSLNHAFGNKNKAFLYGALSGAVEPLAAIFGFFLAAQLRILQPWLLAFAAGAMLFVVAEDLLPESKTQGGGAACAWSVVAGFVLMMILDVMH